MLIIPFLQTEALHGAVPELLELTWREVQGLRFTLEAPELFCPCYLPGRCLLVSGERLCPQGLGRTWTLGNDDNDSSSNS